MTPDRTTANFAQRPGAESQSKLAWKTAGTGPKKEPATPISWIELLGCEVDARRQRYLRARLQLAHLPFVKTFDQFDFGFQPSIDERQIRELRTLRFVHEASNVILLGPPGVGKRI